jgi:hypothetical protein
VCELLVLHGLFEPTGLLPEEALPSREVCSLEESVLENPFHAPEGLDHVRPVVVEVPELAVVLLVGPPEWVLLEDLVLLEVLAHPPALVVSQREAVLLEEGVDSGDAAVPGVVKVLQRQPAILSLRLLPLQGILCPDPLGIDELGFPGLDVAVEVGDELVLLVAHTGPEVRDPCVGLLAVPQVCLRDQNVAHREHTEAAKLLWGVTK